VRSRARAPLRVLRLVMPRRTVRCASRSLTLGILSLALTACPLPQPLAEVARTADGGTVSTPIILPETALPADTIVPVRTDCAPAARFTLSATVEDIDTEEAVEARWFLDYGTDHAVLLGDDAVPSADDPSDPRRAITPIVFQPYGYGVPPSIELHVVEVVVSNSFLPLDNPTPPLQRAASPPFLTQSYRWTFQYTADGRCQ
jgi:hypothetical protein